VIILQVAKVVAFLAAIEAICWLFGVISIHRGNPYRLYYPDVLAAQVEANLPTERSAPITGWPGSERLQGRPHPSPYLRPCGSAWGGSFTFGDDVPDADAWPYLLSVKLGCEIDNLGIDGFGFDQSLLLFQQEQPHNSIVILGLAQPMITVGAASSWTFMDIKDYLPQAKLTKPFFMLDEGRLQLHSRPSADVEAIIAHYRKDDYGSGWTPLGFPFTAAVSLGIYRKYTKLNLLQFSAMDQLPELVRQREVANRTIANMDKIARSDGNRFVVLLIPRPEDSITPSPAFEAMFGSLAKMVPEACLIDPSPELKSAASALKRPEDIMTKTSHFTTAGQIALADAVYRGLAACQIKP
jgi:hypothetical protein